MGHIGLAAPVRSRACWYFKSPTSFPLARLLDIKSKDLESHTTLHLASITEVLTPEAREGPDMNDLRERACSEYPKA